MGMAKRIINVPVKDTDKMLYLMERLSTLNLDLEAESRPGFVRIVAHGGKDEIRSIELKIKEFMKAK